MEKLKGKLFIVSLVMALVVTMVSKLTVSNAAAEEKVLKIGTLAPLTLKEGVEIKRWMELFAKIVNEKGGWKIGNDTYKLQSIVYDGAMRDAAKARAAAERLVFQDGVKIMVSNWGEMPNQTATITEPNKVLWLGCDFTDATIKPDLKYFIRASGVYFARGLSYVIQKDFMARGAQREISVNSDTESGRVGNVLWGEAAKLAGMKVIPGLTYPPDTADFGPVATKIVALKPDLVELSFVTGDQITNIIAALKDAGYKGFISPANLNPTILANTIAKVGKEYVEGMEYNNFDPRGVHNDPKMQALIDRYMKEYGEFRYEGVFWVGPWFIFEDAVQATKSVDVEVLRKYLTESKNGVMTLGGYSQLFARPDKGVLQTVDVAPGHGIGIVKDGQLKLLKKVSVKDQYLVSIKVYGLVDTYQKYWEQYGRPKFPNEPSAIDFKDIIN
jgi:branched-chain amino acid transport system substrate-binding protein